MDALRARAAALQKGVEAELSVGIDVMVPISALVAALEDFALAFPTVSLSLCIEALGGVGELVLSRTCDVGISTELPDMPDEIRQQPIGSVRLVPVAAPDHPLARDGSVLDRDAVREATQIVLTDRTHFTEGRDIAVLSLKTWRIGDLGAKHALLRAGLGWGNMPVHMVKDDLASGRLVELPLSEGRSHDYPLGLVHRSDRLLGPAATALAERLSRVVSDVKVP
jgi:DNA-binding transcriptional LysR family regulator